MRVFFLWSFRLALVSFVLVLLYINLKLYDSPACAPYAGGSENTDVLRQLNYLQRAIHVERADVAMQAQYPEGYVFMHALYGLAWSETAKGPGVVADQIRQQALREIARSLQALDSPTGKSVFNPDLPLEYGAFYQGWTTYLRGSMLQLIPPPMRDTQMVTRFQASCAAIAQAITRTDQPYLESYRGAVWPADNIVCLAALSLHDQILEPRFRSVKNEWLNRIKETALPGYELIPHDYNPGNRISRERGRGSSQSLMLVFLLEVDSTFAVRQYQNFRKHFLATCMGLPGIREYPHGIQGKEDIDSGPVLLGFGGAATIVGIKTAQRFKDWDLAVALRNSVETLLLPQQSETEKTYLFGKLPILDAFLAWSNTGICEVCRLETGSWRRPFQRTSLLLFVLIALGYWLTIKYRTKKRGSATTALPQP